MVPSKDTKNQESRGLSSRSTKTLRDIMGIIERHPSIREARRREMLSAIRRVARALGKQPEDVTALPVAALQKELAQVNYIRAGFSKDRWTNTRSLTLGALRLSGASIMPSRWQKSEYSPAWKALRLSCDSTYFLIGLSRFMNFASTRGIEPSQVNEATFAAFKEALRGGSLVQNPDKAFREACRLWNKAGASVLGWPPFRVDFEERSQKYSLEWSAFPSSLKADVDAFLSFGGNRDILSDDYVPSVRPATTDNRRKSLRQLATALASSGFPREKITGLASLVQPDNAKAILGYFLERADGVPKDSIYGLACLLRTVARSWVKNVPDYPKLDQFCRALGHESVKRKGMKERNRKRLRQFDDESNVALLLGLPSKLTRLGQQQDTGSNAALSYFIYGVAIEILIVSAIRIKNLVTLKVGENLILPHDRKKGRVVLWIPPDDVKNSAPIEMRLPHASSQLIMNYLEVIRSRVSAVENDWLFPNLRGKQRNIVGFGKQLSVLIKRHTGLEMHPHLFRHLSLKFLEEDDPNSAEIGRRLLAHKHIGTTLNSYSEGKTGAAHKKYEDLIDSKRAGPFTSSKGKGKSHEPSWP